MLHFHQPFWIAVGIACCALVWIMLRHLERRRTMLLQLFAADQLIPALTANISHKKRRFKKYIVLTAILLCFMALARPQYGHRWVNVKHKGIDLLFALDISKSMLAADIRPNRLERSKLAILDFVANLSGDRVGLLPFAGSSYLICPLTADYQAFEQTLMSVDQATIPDGGTDIGAAIDTALATLTNEANHKILVMITDGEQLQGDVLAASRRASDNGMIIHTVGVGTTEGELIPDLESGGFMQDQNGTYVKSRLDQKRLASIAETTGGLFVLLGDQGQGLEAVYREKLALIPQTELAEKRKQMPIERFGWPIGAAIILLSFELLLSGRKNGSPGTTTAKWFSRVFTSDKRFGILVVVLFGALTSTPAELRSSEAEDLYGRGKYLEAGQNYQRLLEKEPTNPKIIFNSGTTEYKNNLFEEAIEAFDQSLATDDLQLQEKSYYNRGNGLYRLGESTLENQPGQLDQTIASWERSISSYEQALALNPDNEKARANYRFVREKLTRLKEEQEKQQEQQNENQQPGNQSQKKNNQQKKADSQTHQEQDQPGEEDENRQDEPAQQDLDNGEQQNGLDTQESDSDPQQQLSEQSQKRPDPGDRQNPVSKQAKPTLMSREEAEQLLQALRAEEGQFGMYAPSQKGKVPRNQDW